MNVPSPRTQPGRMSPPPVGNWRPIIAGLIATLFCGAAPVTWAADSQLFAAVAADNVAAARTLLHSGQHAVDARDADQRGVLHLAAAVGSAEMVVLLVGQGADVYSRDFRGTTPLAVAATNGNLAAISALLDFGAPIDATDPSGVTPLLAATRAGQAESMKLLIERGANPRLRMASGEGLLFAAIDSGNPDILRLSLAFQPNLDEPNGEGYTPLARALGQPPMVKILLEGGADTLHPLTIGRGEASYQLPVVSLAALAGNTAAIELLVEYGASLEQTGDLGLSPLLAACLGGRWEAARFLLERGAAAEGALGAIPATLDKRQRQGMTALMLAAEAGSAQTVGLLLGRNAGLAARTPLGWTALMLALRQGHQDVARLLEARGATLSDAERLLVDGGAVEDADATARAALGAARALLEAYRVGHSGYPAELRVLQGFAPTAQVNLDYARGAASGGAYGTFQLTARHAAGAHEYRVVSGTQTLFERSLDNPALPWEIRLTTAPGHTPAGRTLNRAVP